MDRPGHNGHLPALLDERQQQVDDERLALPLVLLALQRLVAQPGSRPMFLKRLSGLQRQLGLVFGSELEVVLGLFGEFCQ